MLGYLSAEIICSEKRTVFRKRNFELRRTDNVQEQISKLIFAANGGCCVNYLLNLFATRSVLRIQLGDIPCINPSFN